MYGFTANCGLREVWGAYGGPLDVGVGELGYRPIEMHIVFSEAGDMPFGPPDPLRAGPNCLPEPHNLFGLVFDANAGFTIGRRKFIYAVLLLHFSLPFFSSLFVRCCLVGVVRQTIL